MRPVSIPWAPPHSIRVGRSGGWLLPEDINELANLGLGIPAVPAQGLQERQLAILGPAGHRLGRDRQQVSDLCRSKVAGFLPARALFSHGPSFLQPEPDQSGQDLDPGGGASSADLRRRWCVMHAAGTPTSSGGRVVRPPAAPRSGRGRPAATALPVAAVWPIGAGAAVATYGLGRVFGSTRG